MDLLPIKIIKTNSKIDYEKSQIEMDNMVGSVIENKSQSVLWFLQHDHIYTIGTSGTKNDIIKNSNITVIKTKRGGKTTYHGPGQRVIYTIIDLKSLAMDIKSFVKNIQEILVKTFFDMGINASILDDNVGVFVKNKFAKYDKIAAIGLRVKKGVVYHGISINIKNDLSFYDNIISCGLLNHGQTSVFDILGKSDVLEFDNIFIKHAKNILGLKII